jgi:hypothetical protein
MSVGLFIASRGCLFIGYGVSTIVAGSANKRIKGKLVEINL